MSTAWSQGNLYTAESDCPTFQYQNLSAKGETPDRKETRSHRIAGSWCRDDNQTPKNDLSRNTMEDQGLHRDVEPMTMMMMMMMMMMTMRCQASYNITLRTI
jgi:hypothetical protein